MKLHLPIRLLSALLAVLITPSVMAATLQRGEGEPETVTSLQEELYEDNIILTIVDGDNISTVRNAQFTGDVTLNMSGGTFTLSENDKIYPDATGGIGFGDGHVVVEMSGGSLVQEAYTYMGEHGQVDLHLSGSAVYECAGSIGVDGSNVNILLEGESLLKIDVPDGYTAGNYNGFIGRDNSTVNITLKDGAKLEFGYGANIGQVGSNVTINVDGGTFSMTKKKSIGASSSKVNINITKGLFEIKEGTSCLGAYNGEVNIKVSGGKLDIRGGKGSIATNNGVANIEVSGGEAIIATHLMEGTAGAVVKVSGGSLTIGVGGSFPMNMGNTSSSPNIEVILSGTGHFKHEDATSIYAGSLTISDHAIYEWCEAVYNFGTYNPGKYEKIVVAGGELINAKRCKETEVIIDTAADFTGELKMGGMSANYIKKVNTAQAVTITELAANTTLTLAKGSHLTAGEMHVSYGDGASTPATALINFIDTGNVVMAEEGDLELDFAYNALDQFKSGELSINITANLTADSDLEWVKKHFSIANGWFADGWEIVSLEGGVLTINASKDRVVVSSELSDEQLQDPGVFNGATKVIIDDDTTLTVSDMGEDTHSTLRQLTGDADLDIQNNDTEHTLTVELLNEESDTTLDGSLTASGLVDFEKSGDASLTVQGNVQTEGNLRVVDGTLTLNGEDNRAGHLDGLGSAANSGDLVINGTLSTEQGSDLSKGSGSISGTGQWVLGGDLTLSKDISMSGIGLELENDSVFDANGAKVDIRALQGAGTVKGDVTVSSGEGEFSGKLDGVLTVSNRASQVLSGVQGEGAELVVADGASATLVPGAAGSVYEYITTKGGNLNLHLYTGAETPGVHVIKDVQLGSDTRLVFQVHFDGGVYENAALSIGGAIKLAKGTTFVFNDVDKALPEGGLKCYLISGSSLEGNTESVDLEFSSLFKLYYTNLRLETEEVMAHAASGKIALAAGGNVNVVLLGDVNKENILTPVAYSDNARAGANLLFNSRYAEDILTEGALLNKVVASVLDMAEAEPARASQVMSAVAGSTVTALGAAQKDALRGEMLRLRSHAAEPVRARHPKSHSVTTWLEGNGAFNSLHNDGDMSGYRLNSWGGTVGASMKPAKDVQVGLALSAQYGDLEASAADSAKGHLDGYYLSFIGHVRQDAWGHSFIATMARNEAKLNRTVDYGAGRYATHGKTDGEGFGAVYELTYDMPLSAGSIFQPLVNVSIVSTSMEAYSESGADGAGLRVNEQKWITGSVAVGARWLGKVGKSLFGRSAQAELRANISQDMGDNQGSANVALLADPLYRQQVKGAKVGRTALQMGAGIAVPVSESSSVYTNVNADLRSGSHQWNVNAGVRFGF